MKILTLIALTLVIGNIVTKSTTKTNLNKNLVKNIDKNRIPEIDHMPDAPLKALIPNDPYMVQHQAVIFLI